MSASQSIAYDGGSFVDGWPLRDSWLLPPEEEPQGLEGQKGPEWGETERERGRGGKGGEGRGGCVGRHFVFLTQIDPFQLVDHGSRAFP